ncbi:MAG: hypothetical protein HY403_09795 [Elusimicrobia bacterium]|nr:hypothetical protein [Elusimicrobiota bacterium]
MPPNEENSDWLEGLNWRGYPRLAPVRDVAGAAEREPAAPRPRRGGDVRVEALARENEALRAKIESWTRLAAEFERRLSEAASSYEDAALESDSARRQCELESARLAGELAAARAELARRESREPAREADLALERERRADLEKALLEARRRVNDLEAELGAARSKGAELAGASLELRRQASASHERLLQARILTDQDVQLLRADMREFLDKLRRIQEAWSAPPPGETP